MANCCCIVVEKQGSQVKVHMLQGQATGCHKNKPLPFGGPGVALGVALAREQASHSAKQQ